MTRNHVDPGVRVYLAGERLELPDDRAKAWIQNGIAIPVVLTSREDAVRRPRRKETR